MKLPNDVEIEVTNNGSKLLTFSYSVYEFRAVVCQFGVFRISIQTQDQYILLDCVHVVIIVAKVLDLCGFSNSSVVIHTMTSTDRYFMMTCNTLNTFTINARLAMLMDSIQAIFESHSWVFVVVTVTNRMFPSQHCTDFRSQTHSNNQCLVQLDSSSSFSQRSRAFTTTFSQVPIPFRASPARYRIPNLVIVLSNGWGSQFQIQVVGWGCLFLFCCVISGRAYSSHLWNCVLT